MEKFFRYLGRKAGQTYSKGRWVYRSLFGSDEEALRAEYLMGRELASRFSKDVIPGGSELQQLIDEIGLQLTDRLTNDIRRFTFKVFQSEEINAFALPGGFIFITNSLIQTFDKDRQKLAFVLGHEIGHVVLGHAFDRLLAQTSTRIISRVWTAKSIFGNVTRNLLSRLIERQYSQEQELDADAFALKLMDSASYDITAAEQSLGLLQRENQENQSLSSYFSTHPAIEERIGTIRQRLQESSE